MPAVPNLEDTVIVLNLAVVGALALGSLALAQDPPPETGPTSPACAEANTALAAAVALTVEYNPNVYPNDTVPEPQAVTVDLLKLVLADEDLGGGARTEVEAAIAAFAARDTACTPPPAPAPKDEFDCADFPLPDGRTAQQVYDADKTDPNRLDEDGDGKACEAPADVSPPADCDTARELGIPLPIKAGDPRYAADLDDDRDNLACEVGEGKPASPPEVIVPDGAPRTGGW